MSDSVPITVKADFSQAALNALRLGALLLCVYACYRILAPFIPLVLWGAIIAVAIYPLHLKLARRLGNRTKLSATLHTLVGLMILIVPLVLLTESLVTSSMDLADQISSDSVRVPPPPEMVQGWPLVGEKLHSSWLLASENLSAALTRFSPQLEAFRGSLIATVGGAGTAALQMFVSIIIAGAFLGTAERSMAAVRAVMNGLVGDRGTLLLTESTTTIRSVGRGILGVAVLESILAAIGMFAAGVPAIGFWTFMLLVLSIVQVPPLLILAPMAVYVLSTAGVFGSTVFIICGVLAVGVDAIVKPVLMGRTADAPMLVVLLGAIGGMILWGIAGLFVGAVTLVWCWEALEFWVMKDDAPPTEPPLSPQVPVKDVMS